jgi:hypothetical protein
MEFTKLLDLFLKEGEFTPIGEINCQYRYFSEEFDIICKLPFGYIIFDEIRTHEESVYFELYRDSSRIGALNRITIKNATIEQSLHNKHQKYLLINF